MNFETERIEFKSEFTEEIYKEVIAFANTYGGILYIGIDNEGNAVGLTDVDDEYTRITNGIRDSILPDVTMFVQYTIQDNKVVRVTVSEGTNKPYYLKRKGLKPSGVYIRQGTSSAQASYEQIRQMIKDSDGDSYEAMRSLEQELTFESASSSFKKFNVEFSEEKYHALGMTQAGGCVFTNLAHLISDQCSHTTKVAVFGDSSKTVFRDSKEFGGSVFKQLDDTYEYLSLCNRKVASFRGLERIEKQDYPEEAIREALLNALVHRDYSYSGSIIININDDAIEFISIGGLPTGLLPEDIRNGISQPRNRSLAEIFHRLRLIESYGTGIRRIYALYSGCSSQPQIEITPNTFKITLPNMNVSEEKCLQEENKAASPQVKQILDYIDKNGFITEAQMMELLNIKKTRAYILAKAACESGVLYSTGRGETKKYYKI